MWAVAVQKESDREKRTPRRCAASSMDDGRSLFILVIYIFFL